MTAAAEQLKRSLKEGRAMHGYLLTCPDDDLLLSLMRECASILIFGDEYHVERLEFCPDFYEYDGTIKVDDVRQMRREVTSSAYSSKNRVFLIKNAHLMNSSSTNAMLKLLEEPPEGTFFLLSGSEDRIIPTIRSRCLIVRLGSIGREGIAEGLRERGADDGSADGFACQGLGVAHIAKKLYDDPAFRTLRTDAIDAFILMLGGGFPFDFAKKIEKNRDAAIAACEFMLAACHDLLAIMSGADASVTRPADDRYAELASCASRLTFLLVDRIAFCLAKTLERLSSNAPIGQLIDRLMTELNAVVKAG